MAIKAAVFRKVHEPLTIESVDVDKPWGREVLVRTAATGVCHSDLHVVDGLGRFALDRPIVLGHEGAGVVEAVGSTGSSAFMGAPTVPTPSSSTARLTSGPATRCARSDGIPRSRSTP